MKKYNANSGWFNESERHSLARQGVKTGRRQIREQIIEKYSSGKSLTRSEASILGHLHTKAFGKKIVPKQREISISFDGNDEKSISRAEKLKIGLENKGYAYIKTIPKGFDKFTLVYRKKSKKK